MVDSIYKGNLEVGKLYLGETLLHQTSNFPVIVTPYGDNPEIIANINHSLFNSYSADKRTDFIVYATELKALGMKSGSSILGMAFKNRDVNNTVKTLNFKLGLKNTEQTTTSSVFDSYYTFQEVFTSDSVDGFIEDTYHMFDFTDSFVWDGTSNIMVTVSHGRPEWEDEDTINVQRNNVVSSGYASSIFYDDEASFPYESDTSLVRQKYIPSIQLNVLGLGVQKSNLSVFMTQAQIILAQKANYSTSTVANLQSVYNEAVLLFNNETVSQARVNSDLERFNSVLAAVVSFIALKALINGIPNNYPQNMYSVDSYSLLNQPIADAEQSMTVSDVSQSVIDNHVTAINLVIGNLVSFIALKALIATKTNYPEYMYTPVSYGALNTAIANAEAVMAISDVSQSVINSHKTTIQTAFSNLVMVPFSAGKLTTLPTEIVSDGLMGYWDTGGRTNETDSLTLIPDISGNGWDMGMSGLAGTKDSGYMGGYGLKHDGIDDLLNTTQIRSLNSAGVSFESVITQPNNVQFKTRIADSVERFPATELSIRFTKSDNSTYGKVFSTYSINDTDYASRQMLLFNYNRPLTSFHLVQVFEITNAIYSQKTYINGVLINSTEAAISQTTFTVNGYFMPIGTPGEYSESLFSSSRMYSKSLTPEEITQNYSYENTRWGLA